MYILLVSTTLSQRNEHQDNTIRVIHPTELFPPTLSIVGGGSGVITEGDSIVLNCTHGNRLGSLIEAWLDPQGVYTFGTILQLSNVQRNQSGLYQCVLTDLLKGQITSSINVTVTCKC